MKEKDENKSGLSASAIQGVIAIVFLLVGYQTALFIHQAAVMKIAANRDEPDTVFVYLPEPKTDGTAELRTIPKINDYVATYDLQPIAKMNNFAGIGEQKVVRKEGYHSPRAEAVRKTLPRKRVESFRFDPNTVSVEDLCRLGFSQKQAESIDNYRKKGGHFRRKEDFAKSYVVADSVFHRLEPYIDIPLTDLNLADSAAFDALPGIGGWFASKIIEHREALGGYSYKEQLLDIYRFDQEKYDALCDLIIVSPEHMTPYPLWTLPADSLRCHPYIKNYETAKAIVFYRENSPKEQWTIDALLNAGILDPTFATNLSRCLIE